MILFSCEKDEINTDTPSDPITNNEKNTETPTETPSSDVYGDWVISHRTANGKEVNQTIWGYCESQSTLTFKESSKGDSNLCFTVGTSTKFTCKIYWCNNRDYSYNKENKELKFHAESLYITAKVLTLNTNTLKMSYTINDVEYVDTYQKK